MRRALWDKTCEEGLFELEPDDAFPALWEWEKTWEKPPTELVTNECLNEVILT